MAGAVDAGREVVEPAKLVGEVGGVGALRARHDDEAGLRHGAVVEAEHAFDDRGKRVGDAERAFPHPIGRALVLDAVQLGAEGGLEVRRGAAEAHVATGRDRLDDRQVMGPGELGDGVDVGAVQGDAGGCEIGHRCRVARLEIERDLQAFAAAHEAEAACPARHEAMTAGEFDEVGLGRHVGIRWLR